MRGREGGREGGREERACLISLYYMIVQGILILSLLIFMPSLYSHSNLKNYLSPLIFNHKLIILMQVSSNTTSSKKIPRHG